MTAKTEAGALALEARRGVEHRAAIWREGFAAGLEAAAARLGNLGWRESATEIRSLPIPEAPTDEH